MEKMRVLHLASFKGNIGDLINNSCIHEQLNSIDGLEFVFVEEEIRQYYGGIVFSEGFIEYVNSFDLFLVGGGSFFDLWVTNTNSGVTINLSEEQCKKITTKVLFYGLGCKEDFGIGEGSVAKFQKILDCVNKQENIMVSVRNDGTKEMFSKLFPEHLLKNVSLIPDNGFFFNISKRLKGICGSPVIGINIGGDNLDVSRYNKDVTYSQFLNTLVETITHVYKNNNAKFILFSHIYKDIKVIHDICELLDDVIIRNNVTCAPYNSGDTGYVFEHILPLYKMCDVVITNRFHGNIIAIGNNIPSIGLGDLKTIENLYKSLGLEHRCIDTKTKDCKKELISLIESSLEDKDNIKQSYKKIVESLYTTNTTFLDKVGKWLKNEN